MKIRIITALIVLICSGPLLGQQHYQFKEGFDPVEADDMLKLNSSFTDTAFEKNSSDYPGYTFLHQTTGIGLDNAWNLWVRKDSTVIIILRGTTHDTKSLLADLYCVMLPARGTLVLPQHDTLDYYLASDTKAAVHAGFLLGFAYLSKDIKPEIDSLYKAGYHNYIVSGHSQGGALCYYISAWLWYSAKQGTYPLMRVKTYANASPKVGNMYFAYDYDNITRSGWTFSLVNSSDIVPEMPFSTQQLESDMNQPNPFIHVDFKKLPPVKRIFVKRAISKMRKGAEKSVKSYQKYLGDYPSMITNKVLPGLELPATVNTMYFVRPGISVPLLENEAYLKHFEAIKKKPNHHGFAEYRFLLRQYYPEAFD